MEPCASTRKRILSAGVAQRFDFEFTRALTMHKLYRGGKLRMMRLVPEDGLFTTSLIRSSRRSAHLHLYRTGSSKRYLEIRIEQASVVTARSTDTRILLAGLQLPKRKETPPVQELSRLYIDFPVSDDAYRFLDGFSEIKRGLRKSESISTSGANDSRRCASSSKIQSKKRSLGTDEQSVEHAAKRRHTADSFPKLLSTGSSNKAAEVQADAHSTSSYEPEKRRSDGTALVQSERSKC